MATSGRVILHLDLDCFYCKLLVVMAKCFAGLGLEPLLMALSTSIVPSQSLRLGATIDILRPFAGQVEQKRLKIPREVPAAVQQWVRCQQSATTSTAPSYRLQPPTKQLEYQQTHCFHLRPDVTCRS